MCVVEKLTCVPELKLAGGENVNDLGDELPEGAATVWKNTAIRKTHNRQILDKLKSVTTTD